jgi:hypothetical protein
MVIKMHLTSCYTLVLAHLIFDFEDGVDAFLRNICSHMDYRAVISQKMAKSDLPL